ncbi:hypothetical protein ACXYMO_08855 [Arenibacterium sp. CAU 1754]
MTRLFYRTFCRLFAAIILATGVVLPVSAQDASGTYTIPLGDYDTVARIFPTDVINQNTGQLDPRWLRSQLPHTIQHYMLSSLKADGVVPPTFTDFEVVDTGTGYEFRFRPDPSQADAAQFYQSAYPQFIGPDVVGQGMTGAEACQKIGSGCWNPLGETFQSYWKFYPPLGLPFARQRTVLLTHYPPYDSLQAGNYLQNATMARWNRILRSVGVPAGTEALYENTIDANPIAAPGAGQGSAYFPVLLASAFFDAPSVGRGYITSMLRLMTRPPQNSARNATLPEAQRLTVPVLVVGSQSRQLWANKFPQTARRSSGTNIPYLNPNDYGLVTLSPRAGAPKTPFMAANHPDVGLLVGDDACPAQIEPGSYSTEGIVAIEKSDLTTACFSYEMGKGGQDLETVVNSCKANWLVDQIPPANAGIVCTNGLIDATFNITQQVDRCTWQEAATWCAANANDLCGRKADWPACTQK